MSQATVPKQQHLKQQNSTTLGTVSQATVPKQQHLKQQNSTTLGHRNCVPSNSSQATALKATELNKNKTQQLCPKQQFPSNNTFGTPMNNCANYQHHAEHTNKFFVGKTTKSYTNVF